MKNILSKVAEAFKRPVEERTATHETDELIHLSDNYKQELFIQTTLAPLLRKIPVQQLYDVEGVVETYSLACDDAKSANERAGIKDDGNTPHYRPGLFAIAFYGPDSLSSDAPTRMHTHGTIDVQVPSAGTVRKEVDKLTEQLMNSNMGEKYPGKVGYGLRVRGKVW